MFKVNNRSTRKNCEICPKSTTKTPEWRQCYFFTRFSSGSILDFEQVNVYWAGTGKPKSTSSYSGIFTHKLSIQRFVRGKHLWHLYYFNSSFYHIILWYIQNMLQRALFHISLIWLFKIFFLCSLPKICHTYPTMMKLGKVIPYQKKIQKIYESSDTPLEFC